MTVRTGRASTCSFELRVDKAMVGASGAVTVRNTWLQNPKLRSTRSPATTRPTWS